MKKTKITINQLLIISTICFNTSCKSITFTSKETWEMPPKPNAKKVYFDEGPNNMYYVDSVNATNLFNNVSDMQTYIKQLETLIERMKDYYNAK